MKRQTLSIVLAVKNEENIIQKCLDAVKNWADEIIIIDNGSTDKTVEICKRYTKKIFFGDGGPLGLIEYNKNLGIQKARSDWILLLDADEQIPEALQKEIENVLEKEKNQRFVAYKIHFTYYFKNTPLKTNFYNDMYNIRLFKKGSGFFACRTNHEQLVVRGRISTLKEPIIHKWCDSYAELFKKTSRYGKQDAYGIYFAGGQSLTKKKKDEIGVYELFLEPSVYMLYLYFLKGFYKDGLKGAAMAVSSGYYLFITYFFLFSILWKTKKSEKKENCIICGTNVWKQVFSITVENKMLSLYQCCFCGLGYIDPFMKKDYHEYDNSFYIIHQRLFQKYMDEIIDYVSLYKPHGKLLDVGAHIGLLVQKAQQLGFDAYGIEPSKRAVEYGTTHFHVRYIGDTIHDQTIKENSFDIITLNHVLEHIEEPNLFLQRLFTIMKPDGIMVVAVPNFSSISRKIWKQRWSGLQPTEHLYFYTPFALKKMLQKNNFIIQKIIVNEPWREYKMTITGILRFLFLGPFYSLCDKIGSGRNLIIVAQKQNFRCKCFSSALPKISAVKGIYKNLSREDSFYES